jgi:hypothetical protein
MLLVGSVTPGVLSMLAGVSGRMVLRVRQRVNRKPTTRVAARCNWQVTWARGQIAMRLSPMGLPGAVHGG